MDTIMDMISIILYGCWEIFKKIFSMEVITVVASIGTAIGTVAVAFWAMFGDKFKLPNLEIEDFNTEGTFGMPPHDGVVWFHLSVRNKSRSVTAKDVRLVLVGVKTKKNGDFSSEQIIPSAFFCTPAEEEKFAQDINDWGVFDFGHVYQNKPPHDGSPRQFKPAIKWIPSGFPGIVTANNKTVRYVVQIRAENYTSKLYEYEVFYDGGWNATNMKDHLSVKRLED